MKARIQSTLVCVVGVCLALAVLFAAQRGEVKATGESPCASELPIGDARDTAPAGRDPGRLSYAVPMTFTPAFTMYLPVVMTKPLLHDCGPGQTILDPQMDVPIAYIDVASLSSALNGETLQATLKIRDVPPTLTFNRIGVPRNRLEYSWGVYVDVDNNPQTGCPSGEGTGGEFFLAVMHFVGQPDSPVIKPIPDGVQVNVWQYYNPTTSSWRSISYATLDVDAQSDTMTLTGNIPGIGPRSRLMLWTYDYNPDGFPESDISDCSRLTDLR